MLHENLPCGYYIWFVGSSDFIRAEIVRVVNDGVGQYVYLQGVDGTIYNWSTITKIRKV